MTRDFKPKCCNRNGIVGELPNGSIHQLRLNESVTHVSMSNRAIEHKVGQRTVDGSVAALLATSSRTWARSRDVLAATDGRGSIVVSSNNNANSLRPASPSRQTRFLLDHCRRICKVCSLLYRYLVLNALRDRTNCLNFRLELLSASAHQSDKKDTSAQINLRRESSDNLVTILLKICLV